VRALNVPEGSPLLDPELLSRSTLLAQEARLCLIAAAVIGAIELASGLEGESGEALRKTLFLGALRALSMRENARQELAPSQSHLGRSYR
jgi:hypothetical protein